MHWVFARRATDLIVRACATTGGGTVLLPAIYCREVAEALDLAGLRHRAYDVGPDLRARHQDVAARMDRDVCAVVVLHPFGLVSPAAEAAPGGVLVIEDAAHAARSAWSGAGVGGRGEITVFSPRKELGWSDGAAASCTGDLSARLGDLPPFDEVRAGWTQLDTAALAADGRRTTAEARRRLGPLLPPAAARGDAEVLTALPLLASDRDAAIGRLRRQGVLAWRWKGALRGCGPLATRVAWRIRRHLLLVPTPCRQELDGTLERIGRLALEPW